MFSFHITSANLMNRIHPALIAIIFSGAFAHAEGDTEASEKIRYQLILPDEKTPEMVKPTETNPFNKFDGSLIKTEEASSAENKVKDALMSMRVSGAAFNPDGSVRAVMLGPIKLERGNIVPQVIPDQEVSLRVNSLSESTIELFWVEKKKNISLPPRPVIIPVNLKPFVRYVLPSADLSGANDPLIAPAAGGGSRPIGYQMAPGAHGAVSEPETRRASIAEEPNSPAAAAVPSRQQQSSPPSVDEKHPGNMLMKLLLDKAVPTQQPQGNSPAK